MRRDSKFDLKTFTIRSIVLQQTSLNSHNKIMMTGKVEATWLLTKSQKHGTHQFVAPKFIPDFDTGISGNAQQVAILTINFVSNQAWAFKTHYSSLLISSEVFFSVEDCGPGSTKIIQQKLRFSFVCSFPPTRTAWGIRSATDFALLYDFPSGSVEGNDTCPTMGEDKSLHRNIALDVMKPAWDNHMVQPNAHIYTLFSLVDYGDELGY